MGKKNKPRLYADCSDGEMRVDGSAVGPWVRLLGGCLIYCDSWFNFQAHMLPLLTEEDTCIGTPFGVTGINLAGPRGRVRIYCSDAWGADRNAVGTLSSHIERSYQVITDFGHEWRPTAAATAMGIISPSIIRYLLPGLPTSWRGLSHAALHAGPIVHVNGGGENIVHIDRRRAYFAAMSKPMPGGTPQRCNLDTAMETASITDCIVRVPYSVVPPLPVHTQRGRVQYPTGVFRGVWPSNILTPAVRERGVEILRHYGSIRWPYSHDGFSRAMAILDEMPKDIAKPLYTRIWGKLSRGTGWEGKLDPDKMRLTRGCGIGWEHTGMAEVDAPKGPFYRPDIAAWITGDNHAATMAAAANLDVTAVHVDSIWCKDSPAVHELYSNRDGGWKHEDIGFNRYYNTGIYATRASDGDHIGYCGYQGNDVPKTADDIEAWVNPKKETRPWWNGKEWLTGQAAINAETESTGGNSGLDRDTEKHDAIRPVRKWYFNPRNAVYAHSEPIEIDETKYIPWHGADPWGADVR